MPIRPIRLPNDFDILAEITPACFAYPENPDWSVQTDEAEGLVDQTRTLKRIWPLLRLGAMLSPAMRDVFQGFLWEQDGRVVGSILVQRRGTTDKWMIGNVGVLPEFRRRGIARGLMTAGLDLIRARGGRIAILDVIDGNLPAIALYQDLGFEQYSGTREMSLTPSGAPPLPDLPAGYRQVEPAAFDWQPRYEMDREIMPGRLVRFEPVEIGTYRPPNMVRVLLPVIRAAQKIGERRFGIHPAQAGRMVARGSCSVPLRGKGTTSLSLRVDPAHAHLAGYLIQLLLHHAIPLGPQQRIEISIPGWQEHLTAPLEAAGFQVRMRYLRMGIEG